MAKVKAKVRMRVIGEHREGCAAVDAVKRKLWVTPFSPCPDERSTKWLDNQGGHRSHSTPWLVFPCNDTDCTCTLIVHANDLMDALERMRTAKGKL